MQAVNLSFGDTDGWQHPCRQVRRREAEGLRKTKQARRQTSTGTSSAKDPESSPDFAEKDCADEPPPLDPTHSYLEDCIAVTKHAIDVAAGRVAFQNARREKVVVELVNLGMYFALEGIKGILWHGVTYTQWYSLRDRLWEAALSFLNLAADLGHVSVAEQAAEDEVDEQPEKADNPSAFVAEVLKQLKEDSHDSLKTLVANAIIADFTQHGCFTNMKQMLLQRFNGMSEICPKVASGAIAAAIRSLHALEFWKGALKASSASPSPDIETFVAMRGKHALNLMSEIKREGIDLAHPHASALDMLARLEPVAVHKLCGFDVWIMEVEGQAPPN